MLANPITTAGIECKGSDSSPVAACTFLSPRPASIRPRTEVPVLSILPHIALNKLNSHSQLWFRQACVPFFDHDSHITNNYLKLDESTTVLGIQRPAILQFRKNVTCGYVSHVDGGCKCVTDAKPHNGESASKCEIILGMKHNSYSKSSLHMYGFVQV